MRSWLFGEHYRELWTAPIEVEVLNLASESGGLKPKGKGGGKQTTSLALEAADGREFRFRSVDKDPTKILPPALRTGLVEDIAKDQTRAQFPGAAVIVAALSDAASVLHVSARLFVMPDDPALGEFRKGFAGMLGTLEENPRIKPPVTAGLEEFEQLENWEPTLEKLLDENPRNRVDTRAYLKARLFDIWIGDWDRHEKQYEWARRRGTTVWYPVAKDRDQAFSDYDGLLTSIIRHRQPRIVRFQPRYPDMIGLVWNARFPDRRLLAGAEWPLWAELAAELQRELTDAVIQEAVGQLPAEYGRLVGTRLAAALRARRDALPAAARAFYRLLAEDAEVQGTDADDVLEIVRSPENGHSVELRLSSVTADGGTEQLTYFRRRYRADETDEVRVYLKGGDDRAVSRGTDDGRVKVRVIGGPGNDVVDGSMGGRTAVYDHEGENRVIRGPGTTVSGKRYVAPLDRDNRPLPDWGQLTYPILTADAGGDLGLLLGVGLAHLEYGFRKHPYASRYSLTAGYATGQRGFRVDFLAESNATNAGKRWEIFARGSEVELVRFYGFGNETPALAPERFYRADQKLVLFQPRYRMGSDRAGLWLGPVAKFSSVDPGADRFLGLVRPYGVGDFGQVGAGASFLADSRKTPTGLETGIRLRLTGNYYAKVWSLQEAFGEAHGDLAVYLTAPVPTRPTVALRVGGKQLFGDVFPFHEAAFLGGPDTVRGLSRNRYAGDRAAFGNAELRLRLGEFKTFVPVALGVFGLADTGRVWFQDERSDKWHRAFGGGLWFSFYRPQYVVSVSAAQDEAHNRRIYFHGGLTF